MQQMTSVMKQFKAMADDEEEDESDDRDVIRLGHNQPEVGVEYPKDEERAEQPQDPVPEEVRGDLLTLPHQHEQRRHREQEEQQHPTIHVRHSAIF